MGIFSLLFDDKIKMINKLIEINIGRLIAKVKKLNLKDLLYYIILFMIIIIYYIKPAM